MTYFVLYDPEPMWRGEAGHIAYSLHRAKIVARIPTFWEQWEIPGYALLSPQGFVECYAYDKIKLGSGLKREGIVAIEPAPGFVPPIENRWEIINKIDAQFIELCKREGVL